MVTKLGVALAIQAAGGGDIPDVLYDSTFKTGNGYIISSSATVDTFGSYLQISADVGIGKKVLGISIQVRPSIQFVSDDIEIEIADGAVASEVVISRVGFGHDDNGASDINAEFQFPLNRTIRDSERLAARVRDSENSVRSYEVYVLVGDAE